jgi:hypothetical protein
MNPRLLLACLLLTTVSAARATDTVPGLSADRIRERTAILASDEFEGRAPARPAKKKPSPTSNANSVPSASSPATPTAPTCRTSRIVGITSQDHRRLRHRRRNPRPRPAQRLHRALPPRHPDRSPCATPRSSSSATASSRPEYGWDDFKGVDVRGKTVLMLINDPLVTRSPTTGHPATTRSSSGRAMTYYGRWTYKHEIASARGAAACFIIHETGPAGYPFAVVGAGCRPRELRPAQRPTATPGASPSRAGSRSKPARPSSPPAAELRSPQKIRRAPRRPSAPSRSRSRATSPSSQTTRDVASRNVIARLPGADPRPRA